MIRLVFLLRRRADLTLAEFSDYWRDEHGPRVASHQSRLGILRYVQAHRIEPAAPRPVDELRGEMLPPYDGVAEVWWESEDRLHEAMKTAAAADVLADEARFVDLPASPIWLAHEYPQFSTSLVPHVARPSTSLVKGCFVLRHRSDLTSDEAHRYWLTAHGPLIRSMAPSLGLLAYQQVHRFETPLEAALREERGTTEETYLGHAEMWFDHAIRRGGPEIATAGVRAADDEARFIDFARSSAWIGKEHVLVDRL